MAPTGSSVHKMVNNPSASPRYTRTAAWMHWTGALLFICACGVGLYMVELPTSVQRLKLMNWHKWLGIGVLLLTLLRLGWRLGHRPPPPQAGGSRLQQRVASAAHGLLYLLMLGVPLLGWAYSSAAGFPITWLGLLPLPDWVPRDRELAAVLKPWHRIASFALIGLVLLHVAAALKHQLIDRDGLLSRMRPW
jgi:cytochrome b561